ncbi:MULTISPECIES: DUF2218 domain-containing protein [unclassified Streptomyces]|uniref:DUF2218 domain-containing protein n=1 Tax=unclassified Streptomyces TaxID=2593676 RepID=UPI0030773C10
MQVDAEDEHDLRRLQALVTGHLERFGRRDGLQVSWERAGSAADPDASGTAGASSGTDTARRRRLELLGVAAAAVVFLAAHLGLGGAVAASWRWTGGAVGALGGVFLVKAAVVGGFVVHRSRAGKRR